MTCYTATVGKWAVECCGLTTRVEPMQKECVWEFTQCTRHTVVNAMAEKQVTSGGLFGFFELIGKLKVG